MTSPNNLATTAPPEDKPKRKKGLTAKQRAFIEAYSGNATKAAIAAGYKPISRAGDNAKEIMRNPLIRAEIEKKMKASLSKFKVSREKVIERWVEMFYDPKVSTKDQLKASELLAKASGMFVERVLTSGDPSTFGLPDNLSVDDLIKLATLPDDQEEEDEEEAADISPT